MKHLITSLLIVLTFCSTQAQLVAGQYAVYATTVQPVSCYGAGNGSITVRVPGWGQAPYTYSLNGGPGQQSNIFNNLQAGNYTITITDANNATTTQQVTLTQPPAPLTYTTTIVPATGSNTPNGCIYLSVTGGTGPYEYNWSNSTNTEDICNLAGGNYCLTITDNNACSATTCVTVNTGSNPFKVYATATDATCYYSNNGSITVTVTGDTGTYQYKLNNGAYQGNNVFTGLTPGLYTITVTNAQNQTVTTNAAINGAAPMVVTGGVSPETTAGAGDGYIQTAVVNGRPPFSFLWSNTEPTQYISSLHQGSYTVTATDYNGCTASAQFTLGTGPKPFFYFKEVTHIRCFGATNGAINLTVEGSNAPYSYVWSNGALTQDVASLAHGQYSVTITGSNNFVFADTILITRPQPVTTTGILANVTCGGTGNGIIDVTAYGGTPPYRYNWNTGTDTTQDLFNLGAGTFVVTVYDARNCPASGLYVVTDPLPVYVANTTAPISCAAGGTGPITVSVQGGEPPYYYQWSDNSTDTATNGPPCTYRVSVTDSKGCVDSVVFYAAAADFVTYATQAGICEGQLYPFRGQQYDTAGFYADTVQLFSCGCDTLYTLSLTMNPVPVSIVYDTAINNETYVFNGQQLTQSGVYYDTLVLPGGCDSIITLYFTRTVNSGIASLANSNIQVYPTPATDVVHINTALAGTYSYTLYNLQGQAILQQTLSQPTFVIDVSSYNSGLYTLMLHTPNGQVPVRLIRE